MKIYDFSIYAHRRAISRAARQVAILSEELNKPGSVPILKNRVTLWFDLHKQVTKKSA